MSVAIPQHRTVLILSCLGIGLSLLFALVNLQRGLPSISAAEAAMAMIYLLNLMYFHLTGHYRIASVIGICATALLLIIVTQGSGMHALYWIYTLPMLGFFLLGLTGGMLINMGLLAVFAVYLLFFTPTFVRLEFIELDIMISYAVVIGLSLFYEAERHKHVARLEHVSNTDPLTGVFNRRRFGELLAAEIERTERYRQPLSLIVLDIDHYKEVNDRHGHGVGDRVLQDIISIINANIRATDYLGRFGGDEFQILTPQTDLRQASALAEKLRELIASQPFDYLNVDVSISVGIANWQQGETADQLFRRADRALYIAKAGGRNQVQVDTQVAPPADHGSVVSIR